MSAFLNDRSLSKYFFHSLLLSMCRGLRNISWCAARFLAFREAHIDYMALRI